MGLLERMFGSLIGGKFGGGAAEGLPVLRPLRQSPAVAQRIFQA